MNGCELYCGEVNDSGLTDSDLDSGANCKYEYLFTGTTNYACIVNISAPGGGMPGSNSLCADDINRNACDVTGCPSDLHVGDGTICTIMDATISGFGTCNYVPRATGKWDASESKCVSCNGQKENRVYDINDSIWGDSLSDTVGNGLTETACNASCDEQAACAPVCTRTNPTVNSIPDTQTKSAGTSATYSVTVANNDSAFSCADTSSFNLTLSGCPGGWTCNIAGSVSAQAGFSSSPTNLTIQSSATATAGTTATITITARHGADNSKTGSKSVTYIVSAANALSVNTSPNSIPASTPRTVFFYVRDSAGVLVQNASVDLSTGQNCNTTTTGFCSLSVNSAVNVTVTASKALYTNGITTIIITGGCGAPASCTGCSDGVACTGGTCYGGVCSSAGALCSSIMCGAPNTVPCVCGTGGPTLSAPNVWCGFTPTCNPGQGFATQAACVTACLGGPVCNPATCAGCANGTPCSGGGTCQSNVCVPPAAVCVPACTGGAVCVGGVCENPCGGPGMFVSPLGPGYCTIGEILAKATNWILSLVASIIILIIIIGGLMYISSAGDEEKLRTSKNIIYYAIIGLGIILISNALITEVADILKGP